MTSAGSDPTQARSVRYGPPSRRRSRSRSRGDRDSQPSRTRIAGTSEVGLGFPVTPGRDSPSRRALTVTFASEYESNATTQSVPRPPAADGRQDYESAVTHGRPDGRSPAGMIDSDLVGPAPATRQRIQGDSVITIESPCWTRFARATVSDSLILQPDSEPGLSPAGLRPRLSLPVPETHWQAFLGFVQVTAASPS